MHDPWSPRRGLGFGGMGGGRLPWVLAGFTVVLFAFLLGRCTAGGGDEEATDTTTTTAAIVTTTTIVIQTTHTVQENETLAAIASRYGVTIAAIAAANPEVTDINNIFRGQVLKIPAPVTATLPTTTTTAKKKNNG